MLKQDFTDADFAALESAIEMPANQRDAIIARITSGQPIDRAPDLALFHKKGILIKDTFANYLSATSYYSTGSFTKLAQGTPLDFKYDITEGVKNELEAYKDRSAFNLGTFVHEAILEPEKWDTVVCEPQASRASHAGLDTLIDFWSQHASGYELPSGAKPDDKKALIAHLQEASGMRCIDSKNALIVQTLYQRWQSYAGGVWADILDKAAREVSIYCDDFMGLPMRVRPDALLFADQVGVNAIVSVKTTSATSIEQYRRDFYRFGYHIKEAAYQRIVSHVTGLDFSTTIQIVLSTAEPFNVGVFILPDMHMASSFDFFARAVERAKACLATDQFPGWEGDSSMGLIDFE